MRVHGIIIWLLLTLVSARPGQAAYQLQFTTVTAGKAAGSVLVLDVSSLWQKHPAQPPLSITTAQECQQRCSTLPGCSAYSFCSNPAGCGTGCRAYTTKNPPLTVAAPAGPSKRGERNEQQRGLQVPILGFGPFVANKASKGCHPSNTDKWAFGTCTLLKAAAANKTAPASEGVGWSSAWLAKALPSQCNGLSAAACGTCYATPSPATCLACMLDKRAGSHTTDATLVADGAIPGSTGNRALDQCGTCARLTGSTLQQKCVACVLDNEACSSCVPYPGAATQVALTAMGGCMECVSSKGKRFTGACLTCSVAQAPGKCYNCLGQFYPKLICKTTTYVDCYKPDFDNPCATCQQGSPEAYNACIGCYLSPQSKPDCDSCSQLATKQSQQQCYSCSKVAEPAHSDVPGGCGLCFAHSASLVSQQQCLACVTSKATTAVNRQHCSLCSAAGLTSQQAARCFKCLQGSSGSSACSTCSSSTSSDAAFKSCMACYGQPDNGPDCNDCAALEGPGSPDTLDDVRRKCFDCVVGSALVAPPDAGFAPLGCCSACFGAGQDTASCVACNTSPATPTPAKTWCLSCSSRKDAASKAACLKCLQSHAFDTSDEYRSKCSI